MAWWRWWSVAHEMAGEDVVVLWMVVWRFRSLPNVDVPCRVVVGHDVDGMPIVPDTIFDGGWVWAGCS